TAAGGLSLFQTVPEWLIRSSQAGPAPMLAGEFALTAAAVFLPSLFMGMALPLLVAGGSAGRCARVGRGYPGHAPGRAARPFLAGFTLIPWLGIRGTLGVMGCAAVLVALIAWALAARPSRLLRAVSAAGMSGVLLCCWLALPAGTYTKSKVEEPRHLLYYR